MGNTFDILRQMQHADAAKLTEALLCSSVHANVPNQYAATKCPFYAPVRKKLTVTHGLFWWISEKYFNDCGIK